MNHPNEQDLALFAGGDLGALGRWRLSRHLRHCAECRSGLETFREAGDLLAVKSAALPEGVEWDRLSGEMAANIRLGLAAGRIVAPAPVLAAQFTWRPAAVLASATALLITAWWLNVPHAKPYLAPQPGTQSASLVQRTDAGIEVKSGNGTLTLLRPRTASVSVEVSTPGSLRERFVDDETGQVTINNVYAE